MKGNDASRTAEYMALFRAIESARPESKRLFDDSFALGFLRPRLRALTRLSEIPLLGEIVPWLIDRKWVAGSASDRRCQNQID